MRTKNKTGWGESKENQRKNTKNNVSINQTHRQESNKDEDQHRDTNHFVYFRWARFHFFERTAGVCNFLNGRQMMAQQVKSASVAVFPKAKAPDRKSEARVTHLGATDDFFFFLPCSRMTKEMLKGSSHTLQKPLCLIIVWTIRSNMFKKTHQGALSFAGRRPGGAEERHVICLCVCVLDTQVGSMRNLLRQLSLDWLSRRVCVSAISPPMQMHTQTHAWGSGDALSARRLLLASPLKAEHDTVNTLWKRCKKSFEAMFRNPFKATVLAHTHANTRTHRQTHVHGWQATTQTCSWENSEALQADLIPLQTSHKGKHELKVNRRQTEKEGNTTTTI